MIAILRHPKGKLANLGMLPYGRHERWPNFQDDRKYRIVTMAGKYGEVVDLGLDLILL